MNKRQRKKYKKKCDAACKAFVTGFRAEMRKNGWMYDYMPPVLIPPEGTLPFWAKAQVGP